MVILKSIVMYVDQPDQMFTILRTAMADYWSGLKEEVMAAWEKNIIYILKKNNYGWFLGLIDGNKLGYFRLVDRHGSQWLCVACYRNNFSFHNQYD